jgi:hypothetical protein
MAVFGMWVGSRIEKGVLQNTAAGVAVYINSFVEPHVQELSKATELSRSPSVRSMPS